MKIRSVRPEFFSDPIVAQMSMGARLLFIGLWCHVDDDGRGEYLPKRIEGDVFPLDDVPFDVLWSELELLGRVVRYVANGAEFFVIPTFTRHQKPNRKYDSKLPAPPVDVVRAVGEQCALSARSHAVEGEVEVDVVHTHTPTQPREGTANEVDVCVSLAKAWGSESKSNLRQARRVVDEVPRLAGLSAGELRRLVDGAKRSGTRTLAGLVSVADSLLPGEPRLLAWCGECDEGTRMFHADDGDRFCDTCHPRRLLK